MMFALFLFVIMGADVVRVAAQTMTYGQFRTPELKMTKGILTVYHDDRKIYLEIPESLLCHDHQITSQ